MNCSQNSATLPSRLPKEAGARLLTRSFEKYGMFFKYQLLEQKHQEWRRVDNTEDAAILDWVDTGNQVAQQYVVNATVKDDIYRDPNNIWLYATADGPMLGIEYSWMTTVHTRMVAYPSVISYRHGRLEFMPIFNCPRILSLQNHAIRNIQAPSELLLAAYPAFILQTKMGKFDIPVARPIHDAEEDSPTPHCT